MPVLSSISKNHPEQDKRLKHIESKLAKFEDQGDPSEPYHDNEIDMTILNALFLLTITHLKTMLMVNLSLTQRNQTF